MAMTNNMACGLKAISGTKYPKMTTPECRCFRTFVHNQILIELSEKIRMLAMDTFRLFSFKAVM